MVTRTSKAAKKKTTKKAKKKVVKKKTTKKSNAIPEHAKWSENLRPVIINLAVRGKTNYEIAMLLGICEKTFYNWLNKYAPDLIQALADATKNPIENAERALYERGMGYSCIETKTHMTKSGTIKTRNIIKHYPPSETALKYYLGNKASKDWKDQQTIVHGADESVKDFAFTLSKTPEEVDKDNGVD